MKDTPRLPDGWTWETVKEQRAKWNLADDLMPVAVALGCVVWATINLDRSQLRKIDGSPT